LKRLKLVLIALVLVAAASFVTRPPASTGAPILTGAQIPETVLARIDAACRDCHSDATRYPWYSYIAPVSMLVRGDVEKGRERLNLSKWQDYPVVRRQRWLSEIANQVQDGEMPLPIYTWLHRDAILTEKDKELIFEWTQTERARLIAESLTR
jgi:hypothetical protein